MTRFIFFCFLCLIFSCSRSVPSGVLPPEKMQDVLWDLMQADELTAHYITTDSSYRTTARRQAVYQLVFNTHKIKKQDFDKSYAYYLNNPKLLKAVFDSLHAQGERMQRQLPPDARSIPDTNFRKGNRVAEE